MTTATLTESNVAVARRWKDVVLNGRNFDAIPELFGEQYVNHMLPAGTTGPAPERMLTEMFATAFPDFTITEEDMVAVDDRVVVRYTFRGTHRGEFNGIPATGKSVSAQGINMLTLENGKIVENWPQLDMLAILQQLGVVPS